MSAEIQKKKIKNFIELETIEQKASPLFEPSALGGKSVKLKGSETGINLNEEEINSTIDPLEIN